MGYFFLDSLQRSLKILPATSWGSVSVPASSSNGSGFAQRLSFKYPRIHCLEQGGLEQDMSGPPVMSFENDSLGSTASLAEQRFPPPPKIVLQAPLFDS